eukprot:8887436-Alexandrium_andersonii.AAC.1
MPGVLPQARWRRVSNTPVCNFHPPSNLPACRPSVPMNPFNNSVSARQFAGASNERKPVSYTHLTLPTICSV